MVSIRHFSTIFFIIELTDEWSTTGPFENEKRAQTHAQFFCSHYFRAAHCDVRLTEMVSLFGNLRTHACRHARKIIPIQMEKFVVDLKCLHTRKEKVDLITVRTPQNFVFWLWQRWKFVRVYEMKLLLHKVIVFCGSALCSFVQRTPENDVKEREMIDIYVFIIWQSSVWYTYTMWCILYAYQQMVFWSFFFRDQEHRTKHDHRHRISYIVLPLCVYIYVCVYMFRCESMKFSEK